MIFCYSANAQFSASWTYFEQIARGLIINRQTGEIVARSFDKFFNWGEGNRITSAPLEVVFDKVDGSLGVLYRQAGQHKIATKGSFSSDQALWATQYLDRYYDLADLPDELTLMFEIIYPDNRIIVDYEDREDLVLLAARNRFSGAYLPFSAVTATADQYGFSLPKTYDFEDVDAILKTLNDLSAKHEGFVGLFEDGQRFKFKGDEYRRLHKIINGFSFKRVLEAFQTETLDDLIALMPDEFYDRIQEWSVLIRETVDQVEANVKLIFADAPKESRKAFAIWVQGEHQNLAPYLFAMLDGKPLAPIVYAKYDWKVASQDV